jgi:hypothetical protein
MMWESRPDHGNFAAISVKKAHRGADYLVLTELWG